MFSGPCLGLGVLVFHVVLGDRGIGAIVLCCRVGFPLVPTWLLRRGTLSNVPNILLSPPFSHGMPRWSRLRMCCLLETLLVSALAVSLAYPHVMPA